MSSSQSPAVHVVSPSPAATPPSWPEGITELSAWPLRTAVLLAEHSYEVTVEALRRFGFGTVLVRPSVDPDKLAVVGPFTFVLVGPEVVNRPDAQEVLRALHEMSPVARVLLLASSGVTVAELLASIRLGVQEVVDPWDELALLSTFRTELHEAGERRERVLAVGAHPDDIEIGCAGTLLEHRRQGDRITLLTLSRGAIGGAAEERVREAQRAAQTIRAQLLMGDLPDTRVSDGIETIRLIEGVVAGLQPTVVYVHSAHDNHQDHRAVHSATLSAVREVATVMAYQSPSASNSFQPTAFVPIDRVMGAKLDVLACHQSQAGRSYLDAEAVVSAARYWARHLAPTRYAEPFEVVRSVRHISSPEH